MSRNKPHEEHPLHEFDYGLIEREEKTRESGEKIRTGLMTGFD